MESRDYDEVNVLHLHFICRSFFLFDIKIISNSVSKILVWITINM